MADMTTDRVRRVLTLAGAEAQEMGHEFVGTQHLLLGLLREGEGIGCAALAQLGFDAGRMYDAVRDQTLRLTAHPEDAPESRDSVPPGGPWDEKEAARVLHDTITGEPAVWDELTDKERLHWRIDVRNFWYALNRLKGDEM